MADSTAPRRHRVRALIVASAAVAVLGIVVWRTLAPPTGAPAYADTRPDEIDEGYASVTHSVFIEATPEQVWEWSNDPALRLEDLVRFENFPAVVGTDRRRVEFADGNYLAEEVLIDSPERFRYMIWGFTSPQRFIVQHGIAEFMYAADGSGTRLTWTYTFLPTIEILRPAVESFLESTMSPMMLETLAAMREGVERSAG